MPPPEFNNIRGNTLIGNRAKNLISDNYHVTLLAAVRRKIPIFVKQRLAAVDRPPLGYDFLILNDGNLSFGNIFLIFQRFSRRVHPSFSIEIIISRSLR